MDDDVEVVVIMDRLVSCSYIYFRNDVTDLFHGIYSHTRRCREVDRESMIEQ